MKMYKQKFYRFQHRGFRDGKEYRGSLSDYRDGIAVIRTMEEDSNVSHYVDFATVGASTGIHDKRGNLLFEDDIIVFDDMPTIEFIVVWDEDNLCWARQNIQGKPNLLSPLLYDNCDFTIIGNIHKK